LTTVSEELAACVGEIAQEFNDTKHRRSNLTQARHLLTSSHLPEAAFITHLYEARAITKDRHLNPAASTQRHLQNPMAYFWIVARDLLGLESPSAEANTSPDTPERPTEQ